MSATWVADMELTFEVPSRDARSEEPCHLG